MRNLEQVKDALQWANDCLEDKGRQWEYPGTTFHVRWEAQKDAIKILNPVLQEYAAKVVENMAMQKEIQSLRNQIEAKNYEISSLRSRNDQLIQKLCTM